MNRKGEFNPLIPFVYHHIVPLLGLVQINWPERIVASQPVVIALLYTAPVIAVGFWA
jgi:hypothetical protein